MENIKNSHFCTNNLFDFYTEGEHINPSLLRSSPSCDRVHEIKKNTVMTKEQFNELWNIYIPESEAGNTLINNGVSERLATALKKACEEGDCLAVEFD